MAARAKRKTAAQKSSAPRRRPLNDSHSLRIREAGRETPPPAKVASGHRRVELKTTLAGTEIMLRAGARYDFPAAEAARLVKSGAAVYVS